MSPVPCLSESVIYLHLAHNPELGHRKVTLPSIENEESLSHFSRILADSLSHGFEVSRIVVHGEELYRHEPPVSIWTRVRKALGAR